MVRHGGCHDLEDHWSTRTPLVNPKNGKPAGMISKETYDIVMKNADVLDSAIIYDRDFSYNL